MHVDRDAQSQTQQNSTLDWTTTSDRKMYGFKWRMMLDTQNERPECFTSDDAIIAFASEVLDTAQKTSNCEFIARTLPRWRSPLPEKFS